MPFMFAPFFVLAAQSPSRQSAFRQAVAAHLVLLGVGVLIVIHQAAGVGAVVLGHLLLVTGIVEGALLIGWRLTQLPRSQALEFLLVSPLRPRPLFLAEALVGLTLLAFVTLSGLPVLLLLVVGGVLDRLDPVPLLLVPFTWGAITGLGLTAWAYEAKRTRRWLERIGLALILLYLIVGILAGENLRRWIDFLPATIRQAILESFVGLHTHNPFGILSHWLQNDFPTAWPRMAGLLVGSLAGIALLLLRAATRLQGHFHERHYEPVRDVRGERRPPIRNRPLAWWAVKRVTEYSGKANLYLAGGFCLLYAAYIIAADQWPAWMGRRIFEICDAGGGIATLTTALVVLSAVPAAFQYGLWDSNTHDRCRRLELLLLTELQPDDYQDAALRAAWVRGRGYFLAAGLLWIAGLIGGRMSLGVVSAAVAAGVLLWVFYFSLGFWAFARGAQANGLGMLLTVGLPLTTWGVARMGWPLFASWLPPGMVHSAGQDGSLAWLVGPMTLAVATLVITRRSLTHGDAQLRHWYDQHHGVQVVR
jgi:hypothetical protein